MMMSKPAPKAEKTEEAPPAFAAPPASKLGTVEDLERRLAMLGSAEEDKKPAAATFVAPVQAPVDVAASVAPVPVKGGKNALLVSTIIMCHN